MSYGYGGRSNPYDQRGAAPGGGYDAPQQQYNPPQGGGYNSQPYDAEAPLYGSNARYNSAQPAMGRDNYGSNVEMQPLAPNGGSFGRQNPNAILDECQDISAEILKVEEDLKNLKSLQQRALDDPDSSLQSSTNTSLNKMNSVTMEKYHILAARVRKMKEQPDSGSPRNAPQVSNVDRKLRVAINTYQRLESDFRAKLRDQMARQYRIVNPNASQAEVEQIVSDPESQQIFQQALLQSDRRGQSRQVYSAVQDRHEAIRKIEQQLTELGNLFNEMEALVVQQEAAVTVIEQKGEEVVENIQGGNEQLVKGVKSARARNRKKWWCLLICIIILIIVAIIVIIYVKVINPPKKKRSLVDALETRDVLADVIAGGLAWIPRGRSIRPMPVDT